MIDSGLPEFCTSYPSDGDMEQIALATAIVTATMASMGYPPSVEDISGAP